MAEKAAGAMSRHLGLCDVVILDERHFERFSYSGPHNFPSHELIFRLKFFAFEITGADEYLFFDADCQCLYAPAQSILDKIHKENRLLAVRDQAFMQYLQPTPAIVRMKEGGQDSVDYFNTGFYVVRSQHKGLMKYCVENMSGDFYPEQTTMNRAVKTLGLDIEYLNRTMNWKPDQSGIQIRPCVWHSKDECIGHIIPDVDAMTAWCERENKNLSIARNDIDAPMPFMPDGFTYSSLTWIHDGIEPMMYNPNP